jgi:hypothetical protein
LREAIGVIALDARDSQDEELGKLAEAVNKYFFNTTKYTKPERLSRTTDNTEEAKLKKDRESFHKEKFDSHKNEVMTRVDNKFKSTIEANIDKKDVMSSYVKNKAIEDALSDLNSRMKNDSRFNNTINRLWEVARKNNYSKDSLDAIRKAHNVFATTHYGNVIAKARGQALKTTKSVKKDNNRRDDNTRRSASSDTKSGDNSANTDKWAGKTTREILDLQLGKV